MSSTAENGKPYCIRNLQLEVVVKQHQKVDQQEVFQIPGASCFIYLRRCRASITKPLEEVLNFKKGIISSYEFTAFKQAGEVLLRCW